MNYYKRIVNEKPKADAEAINQRNELLREIARLQEEVKKLESQYQFEYVLQLAS